MSGELEEADQVDTKVTIETVARKAGVSISTVSRVLNQQHTGDPEIRKRVLSAAEELAYTPSAAARTLAGGGGRSPSTSMSYVMHSFIPLRTYYGDILRGAEEEAQRRGYDLYFSTAYHQLAALGAGSVPKGLSGESIRGVIYAGEIPPDFHQELKRAGIPLVHINAYPPGEAADCVMCDNFTASYRAIRWLVVELGHRRIACIAISGQPPSTEERVMGYRQALFDAGIPFNPDLLQRASFDSRSWHEAMARLLQVSPRPTAVFGVTDEMAIGALQCAKSAGLRVPEDLSVVGVNDLDIAQMCDPPLTTVRIFREEIGRVAVGRLMELIQKPGGRPRRIDVLCELVVRQSCTAVS